MANNYGPPAIDFSGLNQGIAALGQGIAAYRRRSRLSELGKSMTGENPDYGAAAQGFFDEGDSDTALKILTYRDTLKKQGLTQSATRDLIGVIGGGESSGSAASTPAGYRPLGELGSPQPSLVASESGGRWDAQNAAVGAGGQKGHFGRLQFGQARLQEAAAAGAIPQGTTPQAFMASPEIQKSAEAWHFGDIDQSIKQNGFNQLVGKVTIGGVPLTVEGLRAVAHLGGKEGMRKFVESNGAYDPADANGTRLSDYFAQHGGGGGRIAQADMPAPDSTPASLDTGGGGFAIPQGDTPPGMNGRTFNAITAGDSMQPAFQAEGASQPWMGSALQRLGQPSQTARQQMPPQRPFDVGADRPAPGAVPAMGQQPPMLQPDLSNTNDGGAKDFAMSQDRNGPSDFSRAFAPTTLAQPQGGMQAPANPAADLPAPGASTTEGAAPVLTRDMPRPATREQAVDFYSTRKMEDAKGQIGKLAAALANPNLPANARAVGEIFLKDALEQSKAPDSVKEFMYARSMGWTTATNPQAYAREKTKTTPIEEVQGRKDAAAAVGLKPGDPGYQGFALTGKMPREDMGPLTATDKKAILEADEGVLAAETAIKALNDAKALSPRALGGWGASGKASIANNLPDWMVPDGMIGSPQKGEATAELENVVTSQALAQLKSIFGAAPTEGERKILMEIQGSIGQPDNVRQKIYDRGIAMAEKRLGFNRQRAADLRGGDFYKSPDRQGQGRTQAAPQQLRQPQAVAAPASAIEFLRSNPGARAQFDAKYGAGASSQVLGQ